MAKYSVEIKKSAVREIKKLSKDDLKKVLATINNLQDNPRPQGAVKLTVKEIYRIRAGNFRILYEIFDNLLLILIVKVGHRREVYR